MQWMAEAMLGTQASAGLHDAPQSVTARFLFTEGVAVDRFAAALSGVARGHSTDEAVLEGRRQPCFEQNG
jgi:hypothetical protein